MAKLFKTVTLSEDLVYLNAYAKISPLNAMEDTRVAPIEKNDSVTDTTCTQLNEQVREELYQTGFTNGFAKGLEQATSDMAEQLNSLKGLLNNIPAAVSEHRLQLTDEIANIVLIIVQQFFIDQQRNKEAIANQINQTIKQLNDKQNIEISLHPHDIALIQQGLINLDLKECKNVQITPDNSLGIGGCFIRSEHGVFDASIERQIDSLKRALLQIKEGGAA